MILTAGVALLISKYTGHTDIVLGTTIYKQKVEGEFINSILSLRNRLEAAMTFKELLLQVKQTIIESVENQNYPIETLIYRLGISTSADHFPLFDTVVLLRNIHEKKFITPFNINMILDFHRNKERIEGEIEYNAYLYRRAAVKRIIDHFLNLLRNSLFNVDIQLAGISILSQPEKRRLLIDFNHTAEEYDTGMTLTGRFERQMEKTPDVKALVGTAPDTIITYRELNDKANKLARILRKKGVRPGRIVTIMVEPSIEMVIALTAILKSGGAYLPIALNYPRARKDYIMTDSNSTILLTNCRETGDFEYRPAGIELLDLRDPSLYNTAGNNLPPVNRVDDLAYVMYTSGSSDRPKGVMVEHRSAVNVVTWFANRYNIQTGTHVLQLSSYTFDASVNQLFGTLHSGGTLFMVPLDMLTNIRRLRQLIENAFVHIINFVPSILNELLGYDKKLDSLQAVISGAERLDDFVKNRLLDRGYTPHNHYGPTETTIDALASLCSEKEVTLGRPIANVKCYIFDHHMNLSPIGAIGELHVVGAGVSRGYLNSPELTHTRFISNPFIKNERMYRTGDLVKRLPGGDIAFVGRADEQVKIRGYRIELGEIKQQLLKHVRVREADVLARAPYETESTTESKEYYLCAYFVSPIHLTSAELKKYLSVELPDYMIPSYFFQLEKMPLTENGKLDRKALPSPWDPGSGSDGDFIAPQTKMEKLIAGEWKKVLKVDTVGANDNFFDIGGNSLKIIQLNNRLDKTFKQEVSLGTIFRYPTVRALAEYLSKENPGEVVSEKEIDASVTRLEDTVNQMMQDGENDEYK
jgi:amino acid adenylation domain-containing protein